MADVKPDHDVTDTAAVTAAPKAEPPWGAIVIIVGIVAIVAIFVAAVLSYDRASDVATATSGVSGVIAALVGAYFGVRGATLAHKQAGEQQEKREQRIAEKQ